MFTEENLLFPTLITKGQRFVSDFEKDNLFSAYLETSTSDGLSMDYLGVNTVHLDSRFTEIFTDISKVVENHLKSLSVDTNKIRIYITKSWFNLTNHSNRNPMHEHAENHLSITYYPHIAEGLEKTLTFHDSNLKRNEPYMSFLSNLHTDLTYINARTCEFIPEEGDIFVFPADMIHETGTGEEEFEEPIPFNTIDDVKNSRFCVGCDVILTRIDVKDYDHLLTPIEVWKQF